VVTLHINNSTCKVEGLDINQLKELRLIMSYIEDKGRGFSKAYGTRRYLMGKRGEFPTGILSLFNQWVVKKAVPHSRVDHRIRPLSGLRTTEVKPLGLDPYPPQLEAVKAAVDAGRGTISAVTGYGKSVIMLLLVKALQLKTLIIVPNISLKRQLLAFFEKSCENLKNVTVENIDSPTLEHATEYDCLIIDESHHSAAATYRRLNKTAWPGIYYRFFFTATPFRSRSEENILLESIAGQVIYRVSYKQAVEAGAIVPIEAYYYDLPKRPDDTYGWPEAYSTHVVNNQARNALIASTVDSLALAGIPTLCLVKEIEHGQAIADMSRIAPPYAKGENDDNSILFQAFNKSRIKTIIGTNGVVGEGIDLKPAEYVIIAGLGKSKNQFMQQVGRVIRKYPGKESGKVILFRDSSNKYTLRHFNAQKKYLLEEYGVIPVKLKV
jgi:superfamily II DNA or RNA helicase